MDDLQLNISVPKRDKKQVSKGPSKPDYKFVSQSQFSGKTIARKRPSKFGNQLNLTNKVSEEPAKKVSKLSAVDNKSEDSIDANLRDLSENKGKFKGKNYQDISDELIVKQKPRPGGWISSLFKNNPDVPHLGQRAVKPIVEKVFTGNNFSDLDIHPHSVANLQQNLGLKELMTVQQNAIPIILQGRDVLIRSQTGSGKTLAYALPIIEGLQAIRPKINRHDGISVVVVLPTRELAVQTYELFVKLVKPFTWIVPGLLSGGQKRKAEKARLRKGLSILVGTPGRINDHLRHTQSLNFSKTNCLVLDEADCLLDMGYEKDVAAIVKAIEDHKKNATYDPMAMIKQTVKKVINDEEADQSDGHQNSDNIEQKADVKHHLTEVFLSKQRQTILLSATLTKAVENLAGLTMVDPVFVDTSEGRAVVADSTKAKPEVANTSNKKEAKPQPEEKVVAEQDVQEDNKEELQLETKRGLKQFSGKKHMDLFDMDDDNTSKSKLDKTTPEPEVKDVSDSDSDSDYEYFKVQKELENKKIKTDSEDDEDVDEKPAGKNTFAEAVKTAVMEDELVLPSSVNQTFLVTPMKLRLVTLCSLIVEHCVMNKKSGKMIVFMATLEMVDYHADLIETVLTGKEAKVKKKDSSKKKKDGSDKEGEQSDESDSEFEVDYQAPPEGGVLAVEIEMFKLHGNMPHEQRMEVFKQFRKAKRGVLICTDVAARGIDVPRVDLVLQYCAPCSATDYVHRVGRTGRAAAVGAAVLMLLPSEAEFVRYLEQRRIRLRQADESRALAPLQDVVPGAASRNRAAVAVQARLEHVAHSSKDWLARASRAYTSWIGFYSGYPREVREYLDARQLHLGHSAKAFALRETPGALARRAKNDPKNKKERPNNKLTVQDDEERKRPGFPRAKVGTLAKRVVNKQSSMHTASEYDSGLPPAESGKKKKKLK